jgi:glycosyltransferase involved in cell wall biosynthesis
MKPKLLFVSNLFPDAAEPYRGLDNATVLHHLAAHHEIRVISPRPWLPGFSRGQGKKAPRPEDVPFRPAFIRAPYLPKIGALANHRLMVAALRRPMTSLRKEFPWDRVLVSWLFPDSWAVLKIAHEISPQATVTAIAQGSDVHVYLRSRLRRRAILQALDQVTATITRSRSLAELLAAAGADATKLQPIYNGVDTAQFHPGGYAEVRAELGVDPAASLLLFVGNFLPVKDPLRLVTHFAAVLKRLPQHPLRLVMIGKGPLESAVDQRLAALGLGDQVQRTGPLLAGDVARWMRAADLLCMTSRNEGLPNVILEAQACGLPVLSTAVGGLHEVVDERWKGSLTPLDDITAWEAAASRLIEAPLDRPRIAQLGLTRTWAATAEAYRQVIERPKS